MTRVITLLALSVALPMVANGQSGTVRYDQATRFEFKLPPEIARNPQFMANMPKNSVQPMQLRFTPTGTTPGYMHVLHDYIAAQKTAENFLGFQ